MSIGKSTTRGQVPNWIGDNDWTPERRLDWLRQILAFSPRSWGQYPHATPGADDPETWAVWCLVMCETKEKALRHWNVYCFPEDYADDPGDED